MTNTVYSGYSGHVYSGHSDIVATLPGRNYIYSIISRSDIVHCICKLVRIRFDLT